MFTLTSTVGSVAMVIRTKHTFGDPVESFRFENDGAPSKLKPLALTINFLMEIGCWKPGQPGSALLFVRFAHVAKLVHSPKRYKQHTAVYRAQ